MKRPIPRLILAAFLAASGVPVGARAQTEHPRLGFAPDRVARIDRFLQQAVDSGRIAGAVALVLRDGQVAYERAVGWSDKESGRRMTSDAIFRIASQTKALTSTAVMMLVEEGKIALGDPVSRFIPAFAHTTVASRADSGRTVVPAKRAITIKDLLTHTSGISYGTDAFVASQYGAKALGPAAGWGWYTADKSEPVCETMERLATLPFVAQPGEAFVYGYSTDVLGCVVERASGVPLDEFIRARITAPLGMRDTHFFLPLGKRGRLATVYASDSTNHITRAPAGPRGQGDYVDGPRRSFAGGAGLLSTARDYARFLEMMLERGALDGARLLSPKTVDVMTTNQTGTLMSQTGLGFGLGFQTTDRLGADGLASVGTYGWGGAYGSTYKVDPAERLVIVFMINQLPNRTDVAAKFPTLVYQALVEPRVVVGARAP
jgi:CubicO group peptidase (beta-lactamase class C family)